MKITLLTAGYDIHYALGLLSGLAGKNIKIEVIGTDEFKTNNVIQHENITFHNFFGRTKTDRSTIGKLFRVLKYYILVFIYVLKTDSNIFHIQWLFKATYFERTLLSIYYKLLSKRIVYTAHDINFKELVGKESLLHRMTLSFLYSFVDHIIVHTDEMKQKLLSDFRLKNEKISVVPIGINIASPNTSLTRQKAKERLMLNNDEKVLLFFGNIAPYKGLEYLISALPEVIKTHNEIKLIIAGRVKKNCDAYWKSIQGEIKKNRLEKHVLEKIEFIPDEEVEIYFKASDVLVLPYKHIFQSGMIILSYRFGLPVISSDVGSLKDDIIEGETGFTYKTESPGDLAKKIITFYECDMFNDLKETKKKVIEYGNNKFSWEMIGEKTYNIYKSLIS